MSLSDYSALEGQIADAPEPIVLKKGTEAKVRIISVKTGVDKNGLQYFMPFFDIPDEPLVSEFSDFFTDLSDFDKLDERQQMRVLRKFRIFAEAFGIDYSKPFAFEEFDGLEGWVILGVSKSDDYGEQNTVNSYIAPK